MKWLITCKQATEFATKKQEGKLSMKKRFQLWLHIAVCGLCKLFDAQSGFITKNSRNMEDHIKDSLTPEEKEKIIAALQKQ